MAGQLPALHLTLLLIFSQAGQISTLKQFTASWLDYLRLLGRDSSLFDECFGSPLLHYIGHVELLLFYRRKGIFLSDWDGTTRALRLVPQLERLHEFESVRWR